MKMKSLFGIKWERMGGPVIMPFILGGLVFLGPGGCKEDEPKPLPVKEVVRVPKKKGPEVKKGKSSPDKQALAVAPEVKTAEEAEPLEYQLRSGRDPFLSFIVVESDSTSPSLEKMRSEKKVLTALQ